MGDRRKFGGMLAFFMLAFMAHLTTGLPSSTAVRDSTHAAKSSSPAGTASNILAAHVFKVNADSPQNYVFSPLGYSSILAILSEGARGATEIDFSNTLRHPTDRTQVRAAYKAALSHLQGDNPLSAPQFKTWLYIYRNNSVDESFKRTLREDYFVDVKDIDRLDLNDWTDEPPVDTTSSSVTTAEPDNSKDIPEFDALKVVHLSDDTRINDNQKDASKFDEVVEEKQYVEVPVIKEEIAQQLKEKELTIKETTVVPDTNSEHVDDTAAESDSPKGHVKESARMRVPLKSFDNFEIMEAKESHFDAREFGARDEGDVASVISGNSIVGKKNNLKPGEIETNETKLILFNGLYYRGSWAIPFRQLRSDAEAANVFYKSNSEKCAAKMMRTIGRFKYAEIPQLKARAIELPYDNERYSLLVVLPNSRNGLSALLSDFSPSTLTDIVDQLSETNVALTLPKFNVDSTSGAEKALKHAGLTAMFTPDADFSGISTEQHLHIDELQQHVSVRIDEGSSSENFLTATNAAERANAVSSELELVVDHPFLFTVRDVVDNVLIVAGKLVDPPKFDGPNGILIQE